MTYTIRTDVPAPAIKRAGAPKAGYPFGELQVNAMFSAPAGEDIAKTIEKFKGAANRWRKAADKKDVKFVVAGTVLPDDPMGVTVVGVWRTA